MEGIRYVNESYDDIFLLYKKEYKICRAGVTFNVQHQNRSKSNPPFLVVDYVGETSEDR